MRLKRLVYKAIQERGLSTGWATKEWVVHGIMMGVYTIMWISYLNSPTWPVTIGLALMVSWWLSNFVHEITHTVGWARRHAPLLFVFENLASPFLDTDQWFYDHAYLHHSYTNTDRDPDVSGAPSWVRFLPESPLYHHHRYQNVYLVLLTTVTAFAKGILPSVLHRWNWASVISFLVILWCSRSHMSQFCSLYMLPGPLFIIPAMLNHIQEECVLGGNRAPDFLVHQLSTTINYRTNALTRLLSFNLDIQIEHHLFPNIAHSTLRRVRDVVQGFCHEEHLPYIEKRGMWEALRDFNRTFSALGHHP